MTVAILVSGVVFAPASASAQTDQARVVGAVIDQTGAFVQGATVTLRNERTGEERKTVVGEDGRYVFAALRPSTYTLRAAKDGFAPLEYTGLQLGVGQELGLDATLQPAGVTETVNVSAELPVLDLGSARMGVNVSPREVEDLPMNGRQMSQLLLQAPGSMNSGTGTWQDIRFSGRAVEQNVIRYDGVEGSAIIDSAPGNLNGEIPTPFKLQASLENVQEFRVESNSFPAEYGTGTGGQVNVVTKSGSNTFRGALFEYYRNDALDAPNHFDKLGGLPKSTLDQHQFGGSVGGPILKDKAFFFGSVEAYRLDAGLNFVEAVPSDAAWARAVLAIAALRPGFLAPNARILAGTSTNPDFDIAQLQGIQKVRETAVSGRIDVRTGSNWSSYLRVFHDQGRNLQPEGVTGRTVTITDNPSNAVWALQGILGDSTINDFKVGYNSAPTRINGIAPAVPGVDFSNIVFNLSGSVANTGIAGQGASSGHRGAGRPCARQQRDERPCAALRSVLAVGDGLAELAAGEPPGEGRRRVPLHPHEDGPAGRHHLLVFEPVGLPGQHGVDDPVPGRHERAERLQQRPDGCAPDRPGVLRVRTRRTSGSCVATSR